jgi:hypothetical protein
MELASPAVDMWRLSICPDRLQKVKSYYGVQITSSDVLATSGKSSRRIATSSLQPEKVQIFALNPSTNFDTGNHRIGRRATETMGELSFLGNEVRIYMSHIYRLLRFILRISPI